MRRRVARRLCGSASVAALTSRQGISTGHSPALGTRQQQQRQSSLLLSRTGHARGRLLVSLNSDTGVPRCAMRWQSTIGGLAGAVAGGEDYGDYESYESYGDGPYDTDTVDDEAPAAMGSGEGQAAEEVHGLEATEPSLAAETATEAEAAADLATLPHYAQDAVVLRLIQEAVPLSSIEDIKEMLKGAKNSKEVRHLLEHVVYRHPLCFDLLNGHGYRVAVLQALTASAPHTHCMHEWFDCVDRFRRLGFVLTRTFAAEGYTAIRQWLSTTFASEGRTPVLVTEGIAHIRELTQWCQEDALVFDHVLYTRIVFLLTMTVGFFDRQNRYRATFPVDFAKRDGIVVEWVIGTERCADFDEAVLQCDAFMEELLELLRKDMPTRPTFSLTYRLIDYYFATDNVEKMLATMEDAAGYGINIAESSTAKLMQLTCALNYPTVPELFLRWRAALPQCVLATPDMSRLLFYYSRSGGGRPCSLCGESYNHRNVSVYRWLQTPPHQRTCPALRLARQRKGELEEAQRLPQNADWSERAFALWELSRARAIEWGPVEWRGFLLCCMFAPTETALRAKALLDAHLDATRMDAFLRATYMRLLRHHAPEQTWPTVRAWRAAEPKLSPIVLQEALMATVSCDNAGPRREGLDAIWRLVLERDSYVMPYTKRFFQRRLTELRQGSKNASNDGGEPLSSEEVRVLEGVIAMQPRHVSLLDMKDSASDFAVGTSKKNVYIPPVTLERIAARQAARSSRSHLHVEGEA